MFQEQPHLQDRAPSYEAPLQKIPQTKKPKQNYKKNSKTNKQKPTNNLNIKSTVP